MIKISLITTERNEKDSIAEFIDSVLAQSQKPDEIVIADGGSTDGTLEVIKEYIHKGAPIKLVNAPGNRSVGRNAAIKAAEYEHIACTDVGSRLDKDWLKNITEPFRKNPKAMAVAGNFKADPRTFFEKVSSTLMLESNDKIDLNTWLPSSRSVAYRKSAWGKVGGYPEYTNFNEDTPFDMALKRAGYNFENGLTAIAYWRPRPDLKEFFKQYYYYAVGDGIDRINYDKVMIQTIIYLLWVIFLMLFLAVNINLALLTLIIFYLSIFRIVIDPWKKIRGFTAANLMILLKITYDFSQIFGYWNGTVNRKKLKVSNKLVR